MRPAVIPQGCYSRTTLRDFWRQPGGLLCSHERSSSSSLHPDSAGAQTAKVPNFFSRTPFSLGVSKNGPRRARSRLDRARRRTRGDARMLFGRATKDNAYYRTMPRVPRYEFEEIRTRWALESTTAATADDRGTRRAMRAATGLASASHEPYRPLGAVDVDRAMCEAPRREDFPPRRALLDPPRDGPRRPVRRASRPPRPTRPGPPGRRPNAAPARHRRQTRDTPRPTPRLSPTRPRVSRRYLLRAPPPPVPRRARERPPRRLSSASRDAFAASRRVASPPTVRGDRREGERLRIDATRRRREPRGASRASRSRARGDVSTKTRRVGRGGRDAREGRFPRGRLATPRRASTRGGATEGAGDARVVRTHAQDGRVRDGGDARGSRRRSGRVRGRRGGSPFSRVRRRRRQRRGDCGGGGGASGGGARGRVRRARVSKDARQANVGGSPKGGARPQISEHRDARGGRGT